MNAQIILTDAITKLNSQRESKNKFNCLFFPQPFPVKMASSTTTKF